MKHKHNLFIILTSCVFLSSCGLASKDLFKGNIYNSPVFAENYYDFWDNQLTPFKESKGELLESKNLFRSYQEFLSTGLDEQAAVWSYFWLPKYYEGEGNYSYYRKMNGVDSSFNYHYLSKLYDGQMFCGGDFQLSRVQINENGFGQYFDKEGNSPKYFAMNYKASIDYTNTTLLKRIHAVDPTVIGTDGDYFHLSDLEMTVSIYTKNSEGINKYDYVNTLDNVKTNHYESYTGIEYEFFGFSLENLPNKSRVVGYSISFNYDDPACNVAKNILGENLDYSLMVYEVMFPFSSWN